MPADAGVQDGRARLLDGHRQLTHLLQRRPVGHEIEHGQPVDDDELLTDPFSDAAHDLHREAHPVRVVATPFIGAMVGCAHDELVDQIALRTHHLNAVIASLLGQLRGRDEVLDRPLDLPGGQAPRDRRTIGALIELGATRSGW